MMNPSKDIVPVTDEPTNLVSLQMINDDLNKYLTEIAYNVFTTTNTTKILDILFANGALRKRIQLNDQGQNPDVVIPQLKVQIETALEPFEKPASDRRTRNPQNEKNDAILQEIYSILNQYGIELNTEKEIDPPPTPLEEYLRRNDEPQYLYDLDVTEIDEMLIINFTYTYLGMAVMIPSEILHDLKYIAYENIKADLKIIIKNSIHKDNKVNLLKLIEEVHKTPEQRASGLCLQILNHNMIPRCIKNEDDINELIYGGKQQMVKSGLPPIYNDLMDKIHITSDANSALAWEVAAARGSKLEINNKKDFPLLQLDAGSGATLPVSEEEQERTKALKKIAEEKLPHHNKQFILTVKQPNGNTLVYIESKNDPVEKFKITCYALDGVNNTEFYANELSTPYVLSKITALNYITDGQNYLFSTTLLKSLGDLIPYIVTCLQTSGDKNIDKTLNMCTSRDYSMIFAALGNVTKWTENRTNILDKKNNAHVIADTTMPGNRNMMFPIMKRERLIYQIMFILGRHITIDDENAELHKKYTELVNKITIILYKDRPEWILLNKNLNAKIGKKGVFDSNSLIKQLQQTLRNISDMASKKGNFEIDPVWVQQAKLLDKTFPIQSQNNQEQTTIQTREGIRFLNKISNHINSFIETINWDEETIKRMFKNIRRNNQNSSDGEKITFTQIEYTIADELYIKISNHQTLKSISNDSGDNTYLDWNAEPNNDKTTDRSESFDSEITAILKSQKSPTNKEAVNQSKRPSDTNIEEPRTHSGSLSTSPTKRTPSPRTVQSSPVPHTDTTLPPVPHTDTTLPPVPLTDRKPVPPTGSKPASIKTRPTRRNGGKKQKNKITKRHRKNKK